MCVKNQTFFSRKLFCFPEKISQILNWIFWKKSLTKQKQEFHKRSTIGIIVVVVVFFISDARRRCCCKFFSEKSFRGKENNDENSLFFFVPLKLPFKCFAFRNSCCSKIKFVFFFWFTLHFDYYQILLIF